MSDIATETMEQTEQTEYQNYTLSEFLDAVAVAPGPERMRLEEDYMEAMYWKAQGQGLTLDEAVARAKSGELKPIGFSGAPRIEGTEEDPAPEMPEGTLTFQDLVMGGGNKWFDLAGEGSYTDALLLTARDYLNNTLGVDITSHGVDLKNLHEAGRVRQNGMDYIVYDLNFYDPKGRARITLQQAENTRGLYSDRAFKSLGPIGGHVGEQMITLQVAVPMSADARRAETSTAARETALSNSYAEVTDLDKMAGAYLRATTSREKPVERTEAYTRVAEMLEKERLITEQWGSFAATAGDRALTPEEFEETKKHMPGPTVKEMLGQIDSIPHPGTRTHVLQQYEGALKAQVENPNLTVYAMSSVMGWSTPEAGGGGGYAGPKYRPPDRREILDMARTYAGVVIGEQNETLVQRATDAYMQTHRRRFDNPSYGEEPLQSLKEIFRATDKYKKVQNLRPDGITEEEWLPRYQSIAERTGIAASRSDQLAVGQASQGLGIDSAQRGAEVSRLATTGQATGTFLDSMRQSIGNVMRMV
jgi:hypothetical protein